MLTLAIARSKLNPQVGKVVSGGNITQEKGLFSLMGNGISLANGDEHTQKKRLELPSLDPKSLTKFVTTMERVSQDMTSTLTGHVNVTQAVTTLAMDIVGLCLFLQGAASSTSSSSSSSLDDGPNAIAAIGACRDCLIAREQSSFNPPLWAPTKQNRQFHRNHKQLNQCICSFINAGRE